MKRTRDYRTEAQLSLESALEPLTVPPSVRIAHPKAKSVLDPEPVPRVRTHRPTLLQRLFRALWRML